MRNRKKAFTLVELLVVISIIALLLAVLIPSMQKARNLAKRVTCSAYLKQCGLGLIAYANSDSGGRIPLANGYKPDYVPRTTYNAIKSASNDSRIMVCPMDTSFRRVKITGLTDQTLNRTYYMEPYPTSWDDGKGMLIGYFYLGGKDLSKWTWQAMEPDAYKWTSPLKISDGGATQVMVDISHRAAGAGDVYSWTEVVHRPSGYIFYYWNAGGRKIEPADLGAEGVNSLQLDGSVRWKGLKSTQKHPRSSPGPYRSYGWW
ncbi:MAG: type II secretion system protein [Phycisphaerae bacterium]|nr:type II secretion system protein [Phycisphaerae bacterium]